MPDHFDTDVLIAGAGPAGLTLAIEPTRHAVPFCLIDKMDGPFIGSRGRGILARTLDFFEDMGVAERIIGTKGDLHDDWRHFQDAYGLQPGNWVLVRPDGYIGMTVLTEASAELEACLAQVLYAKHH
ncbi:FAD-dependent monooxygenase [Komagataeibacter xylinus]|uniref:FAD-binding domain-containing protein n=1 Tax=Komagataeibacter xylinus TaxID=28448 RepID=A0A857FWW2_KOMXY|nr:FAD-dependent monooxygenase [Komagataeibacter xylinus]QHC37344.1 hypothetical protein FMA36_17165 [Komagataeibacter xylinus]